MCLHPMAHSSEGRYCHKPEFHLLTSPDWRLCYTHRSCENEETIVAAASEKSERESLIENLVSPQGEEPPTPTKVS